MKSDISYRNRLSKYFDAHYQEYAESAEWYVDPAPNQWKFEISGIGVVILSCSDEGKITESIKASGGRDNA